MYIKKKKKIEKTVDEPCPVTGAVAGEGGKGINNADYPRRRAENRGTKVLAKFSPGGHVVFSSPDAVGKRVVSKTNVSTVLFYNKRVFFFSMKCGKTTRYQVV